MDGTARFLLGGVLGAALGYLLSQKSQQQRVALEGESGAVGVVELPEAVTVRPLPGDQVPLGKIWAQTLRFEGEGQCGSAASSANGTIGVGSGDGVASTPYSRRPMARASSRVTLAEGCAGSSGARAPTSAT